MFQHDNSINPLNLGSTGRDLKPAKARKFKTLLMNGFEGVVDYAVVTAAIKGVKPEFLNRKRVTITVGLGYCELDFSDLLKMFHERNVIPVIKTEDYEDAGEQYRCMNVARSMCNYLLCDPDNLDIPMIVFDFAKTPDACKFMNDYMISHYTESLTPIRQNQMEISRVKNGTSGGIIEIPVKINLGS